MNITKENKKIKALEILKQLNIFTPYIKGFKERNEVCYYENFAGFWAWQDEDLMQKITEFENKYNCLVYAVTHEYTEFGELYDLLFIPNNKEDWDYIIEQVSSNEFYLFAYCYNKDDDNCSEFGTIAIKSIGGGIKRIG